LGKLKLEVSLFQLETALKLCAIPRCIIVATSSVSICSEIHLPQGP